MLMKHISELQKILSSFLEQLKSVCFLRRKLVLLTTKFAVWMLR